MEADLIFEKWEMTIGKLILACARVEYELFRLYNYWIPAKTFHNDNYEKRYDKFIGLVKMKLNNDTIVNQLIEMKSFVKFRHIIAHNPIHYSNSHNEWRIFDLKNNNKSIPLDELIDISKKANDLSIRLSANLRINVN